MMTKKNFIALAEGMHERWLGIANNGRHPAPIEDAEAKGFVSAVQVACDCLKEDNPSFDRERFLVAVFGEADWRQILTDYGYAGR